MPANDPVAELEPRFSSDDATAIPWSEATRALGSAETYWLATVRPEGRPHVTPLIAVWQDRALYFCTGADERKAKNHKRNPHCVITTGRNELDEGLDLVVEGEAAKMSDEATLQRAADAYASKYEPMWHITVRDGGVFTGEGGNQAVVYQVTPTKAFGFGRGTFSQTRWRFSG